MELEWSAQVALFFRMLRLLGWGQPDGEAVEWRGPSLRDYRGMDWPGSLGAQRACSAFLRGKV